jgi:hypothetical protein
MTTSADELHKMFSELDLTCKSQVACRRQRAVLLNIKKLTDTIRKELLQQSTAMKKPKVIVEPVAVVEPVEPVAVLEPVAVVEPVELAIAAESLVALSLSPEPTPRKLKKTKR